ncbi:MAG: hypothetical protein FWC39_08020 [Bacteroidetes bacterium]|nr:hypothetical protein [Bacteroidota bacterium]
MAKNFPDVWIGRVEKQLTNKDVAPWLDGIAELSVEPVMIGEGTDAEKSLIYIPTTDFEPGVLINNSTYPIALQEYDDDTATIALDKFQTKVTTLSDDQVLGAVYDKIDAATKTHVVAINTNKYGKAIHALAPNKNTDLTPLVRTTGLNDGAGRKKLTKNDLVALKKKFDLMMVPMQGRRLVLCPDHIADLLELDQVFANQYYNYSEGRIAKAFGFEIYEYVANPIYTASTGVKKSFGAVVLEGDYMASVAFYDQNVAKKTGLTKQYFQDSQTDPQYQTNRLNYRHYFITIPKTMRYIGAIISDVVVVEVP